MVFPKHASLTMSIAFNSPHQLPQTINPQNVGFQRGPRKMEGPAPLRFQGYSCPRPTNTPVSAWHSEEGERQFVPLKCHLKLESCAYSLLKRFSSGPCLVLLPRQLLCPEGRLPLAGAPSLLRDQLSCRNSADRQTNADPKPGQGSGYPFGSPE